MSASVQRPITRPGLQFFHEHGQDSAHGMCVAKPLWRRPLTIYIVTTNWKNSDAKSDAVPVVRPSFIMMWIPSRTPTDAFSAARDGRQGSHLSSPISVVLHSDPGLCQEVCGQVVYPGYNNSDRTQATTRNTGQLEFNTNCQLAMGPDKNRMIPRHAWPKSVCLTTSSHRYWLREGFSENFRLVM
jgi:hypothetical protein